jgi:hypothetical protein
MRRRQPAAPPTRRPRRFEEGATPSPGRRRPQPLSPRGSIVTSPRTYSSGNRFSLMEAAQRLHRYQTAGEPRRAQCQRPLPTLPCCVQCQRPYSSSLMPSASGPKPLHMEGPEMSDPDLCSCSAGSTPIDHGASLVAAEHRSTLPRCAQSQRTLLLFPAASSASGLTLLRCAQCQRTYSHMPGRPRSGRHLLQPALQSAGGKLWPHQVAAGTFTVSGPQYTSRGRTP